MFLTSGGNLSTNTKGAPRTVCFVVKLCVQMNQSVTRHLAFTDFVIDGKMLTHKI